MTTADLIAVMSHGRLEQAGTPQEVYERPAGRFVADFIGAVNLLTGRVAGHEGGLLLVDNLLWAHRASMQPSAADPASVKAIRKFNEELLGHPQLVATIIPVGDGVGVATRVR
jgi:ABC-type Fe3+/spermidine/putrescine transport system ATPase subunit